MAYKYKAEQTKGEKIKKLLRKLTLGAVFGAAVAGTGANYYASNEELLVRIESVERINAASGEAPHMVIHTDKGTFVNEPIKMRLKDQADAAEIAQYIRPGETIRITVYGLNPHIGKYTRDDIHFFRNIIKIHPGPGQMIVVPPGAAIPGTDIPAAPTGTLTDNAIIEDQTAPEASALNADFNAVSKNTPQLARALRLMDQLPITGRPVYDMLKDPKNHIQSTLFPVPVGEGSLSTYSAKKARIGRGTGTSIAFHEWFHAYQDYTEGRKDMFTLTVKDAVIANFLEEAAAVAYEIASRREAENKNLQFETPRQWVETHADGSSTIHYITSSASDVRNLKVFDDAYAASFEQNAGLDAQAREAKALEAGGKAVIRRLMAAEDNAWRNTYAALAVQNVNNNLHAFREDGSSPGYAAKRAEVLASRGGVGTALNFIPDEYLGPQADAAIEKSFNAMGMKIETVPPRTSRAPSPRHAANGYS